MSRLQSRVRYAQTTSSIHFQEPYVVIVDRKVPSKFYAGWKPVVRVTAGESLKSIRAVEGLAQKILLRYRSRDITLVAMGGGSVGDAVGFLSSILWRGVRLVHVPTTLLSMADSAHGGKTAVNLNSLKNQLGTFYPAHDIWLIKDILNQLPKKMLEEGMPEIIKAMLLRSSKTVQGWLKKSPESIDAWSALKTAVDIKYAICRKDPFEKTGYRYLLNLGHTLGHAIEATTGLPHGLSIAWGLLGMGEISKKFGFKHQDRLLFLLQPFLKWPKSWPSEKRMRDVMCFDKKHAKGLTSVILKDWGRPQLTKDVTLDDWVKAYQVIRKISI